MELIKTYTQADFLTGVAPNEDIEGLGLWASALGLNPFIGGEVRGHIANSQAPTEPWSGTIVDTPIAWAADIDGTASTGKNYLYILGDQGNFYSIDLNDDSIVNLRATTNRIGTLAGSSTAIGGIFIYRPKSGSKYLYYVQDDRIGRWDMTTPTSYNAGEWTDNYIGPSGTVNDSSLSGNYHPVHKMFDRVYIGNGNVLARISDGGSDVTWTANVLDFEAQEKIYAITDDGFYLIPCVSKHAGAGATYLRTENRVVFWNRVASSWDQEWPVPDAAITGAARGENENYVFTGRGIWNFSFADKPLRIRRLDGDTRVNIGNENAVDLLEGTVIFGNDLTTYGRFAPNAPTAFHNPFNGHTGDVSMIAANIADRKIYVGTQNNELYEYDYASTSFSNTEHQTVFQTLKKRYSIHAYRAVFTSASSGATFVLKILSPSDNKTFPNLTDSQLEAGNSRFVTLNDAGALETDTLKLGITMKTAAMELKRLEIWGEPLTE